MVHAVDRLSRATQSWNFDDVALRPRLSTVLPEEISLSTSIGPLTLRRPLLAAAMDQNSSVELCIAVAAAGGCGIIPRWPIERRLSSIRAVKSHQVDSETASLNANGQLVVAVTLSEGETGLVEQLVHAGADMLVLDSAHGARMLFVEQVHDIRRTIGSDIALLAGNVASVDAAYEIASAGANGVKVGLGVGSICTTTQMTGVGVPQLTAIAEISDAISTTNAAVITEGGIRSSADIVKALACGASAVSLGNLLARSEEAAGPIVSVSAERRMRRYAANFYPELAYIEGDHLVPGEGLEGLVPIAGSSQKIIDQLCTGVRAGLGFCGARDIDELQQVAEFISTSATVDRPLLDPQPLSAISKQGARITTSLDGADQLPLFGVDDSPDIGVAVLVWEDDRRRQLLIGRRREKVYALPGGHWSRGESLAAGASREVREETGLELGKLTLASVHELYNKAKREWFITIGFQAVRRGGNMRADPEGGFSELQWFTAEEALRLKPIFASDRIFIQRVLSGQIYDG